MQLRTGKITGQPLTTVPTVVPTAVPTAVDIQNTYEYQLNLYKQELKGMFDELEEWGDCPSARIGGMIDILSYVDDYCDNFKKSPKLERLNAAIKKGVENIMSDILRLAKTSEPYIVELLQKLAPILVSVTAKLG